MKAVGVKALKNNLSRYLQMVRKGTLVYVTDRDEVIAEIRKPTRSAVGQVSPWESYLNQAEQSGLLQRAARKKSAMFQPSTYGNAVQLDVQSILDETRQDRFPL